MSIKLDTPLQAWVYLNRVVEGPSHTLAAALAEFGPQKVAHAIYHQADWLGKLRDETAARRDWLRQDEDLRSAQECGARLITPEDEEWPRELFNSAFSFFHTAAGDAPASFSAEAVAPHSLWVRGKPLEPLVQQSVAIVGTRAISRYGYDTTTRMASSLASQRWTVVSGGALGVDTAAHEAALSVHGHTVAVAASGIDVNYPARNANLFDSIAQSGAVISEFPPGTTPQRHRFLTRNRLVAALSQGTVCVEAAFRSGALNTMNWAEAMGRVVMAVPGPVNNAGSVGCHVRIQENRAQLVTSADEVRELVGALGEVDVQGQMELNFAQSPTQRLSRNELKVFDATPCGEWGSAGDIARDAAMNTGLVIHLLVALEKMGLVSRNGHVWSRPYAPEA